MNPYSQKIRYHLPFLFSNSVLLLYALHYVVPFNSFFLSLVIVPLIFAVPGLPWLYVLGIKTKDPISLLFYMIFLSISILIVITVAQYLIGLEAASLSQFLFILIFTNLGFAASRRSAPLQALISWQGKRERILLFIFCFFLYLALWNSAKSVVPPLQDHDMDLQATSYGLVHSLKPFYVSNQYEIYNFFHPPLLHSYAAFSFLLSDSLDELKYYYDAVPEALAIFGDEYRGKYGIDLSPDKREKLTAIFERESDLYDSKPFLIETRLPNIVFSVLTGGVLFYFLRYLTRSTGMSFLGCLVYFSFPEVFIRSSYGGYMAITNFSLILMAYLYVTNTEGENDMALLFTGIFAALANHKAMILPLAMALREYLLLPQKVVSWKNFLSPLNNHAVKGFALGTLMFWIYGISIDMDRFYLIHFRTHFLDRLLHRNIYGYPGYPSFLGLWKEFHLHLGVPFLLLSAALSIALLREMRERKSVLAFWFLTGGLIFSVVDWRQTKHLMLVVLPLVVIAIDFSAKRSLLVKSGISLVLLFIIGHNIGVIVELARDFAFLTPSPDW